MTLEAVLSAKRNWHVERCDVLDGLRMLPDRCVNAVVTSPPYYALRSYLPADHADKAKERMEGEVSDAIEIPGLPGRWTQIESRYDYTTDKCRCPACGGLGFPWRGWFSCDDCPCKAVVGDGRAFVPANPRRAADEER